MVSTGTRKIRTTRHDVVTDELDRETRRAAGQLRRPRGADARDRRDVAAAAAGAVVGGREPARRPGARGAWRGGRAARWRLRRELRRLPQRSDRGEADDPVADEP